MNYNLLFEAKIGISNISLPKNLSWINVFQFMDDWLLCKIFQQKLFQELFSQILMNNVLLKYKIKFP